MPVFESILVMLAGAVVLTACARRLKLPYPSMLALGGVVLVLIGLQVGPIYDALEPAERTNYLRIAGAVLGVVVAVRIGWVSLYNRIAWAKVKLFGPGNWPGTFQPTLAASAVVGWSGMRGIVTLADAQAADSSESESDARNRLRARIVTAQRLALVRMRETGEIGDDAFHRVEERLDYAEVNVR
jgi:NhaP-type Na+/H+ or K+/H+ antiporter